MTSMAPSLNVFGELLVSCGTDPMTGFFRDGCCNTSDADHGSHTVCVSVTAEFLAFSKGRGNDLTTAVPEFEFPGLQAGDHWCLCASRWLEACRAGAAPKVWLARTHQRALEVVDLSLLRQHAADLH